MYLEFCKDGDYSPIIMCQFLIGNVSLVNSVNQEYLCECQFLIGNVSQYKKCLTSASVSCQFLIGNVSRKHMKGDIMSDCVNSL